MVQLNALMNNLWIIHSNLNKIVCYLRKMLGMEISEELFTCRLLSSLRYLLLVIDVLKDFDCEVKVKLLKILVFPGRNL